MSDNLYSYLEFFLCPDCKSECRLESNTLNCSNCSRTFSLNEGILSALPNESTDKSPTDELRKASYKYWDGGIPGTVVGGYARGRVTSDPGTAQWYTEGDQARYDDYKRIAEFCEFEKFRGLSVLDIGPGRGQESHGFVKSDANVVALDYAMQGALLTQARAKVFNIPLTVLQGDATQLPIRDEYFDLVFSYGVLHHIPDISKSIEEVSRVTKTGGKVKVMLYHKGYFYYKTMFLKWYLLKGNFLNYSWKEYIHIAMEQRQGPCPVVYIYSKKELYALFEGTDLKVVDYFTDEIIDGRLVRWGLFPKWLVNKWRDALGAYAYITLIKSNAPEK